jgi:hypothetical protein
MVTSTSSNRAVENGSRSAEARRWWIAARSAVEAEVAAASIVVETSTPTSVAEG